LKKVQNNNTYHSIVNWFNKGNLVDILHSLSDKEYEKTLNSVPGLNDIIRKYFPNEDQNTQLLFMEFLLHGLAEYSLLSKFRLEYGVQFKDMLSSMFTMSAEDEDMDSDPDLYK
jgi:magnesium chelatase subunit I